MKNNITLVCIFLFALTTKAQVYTLPYSQDFSSTTFLPQDWEAFGSNTNAAWEHSPSVGAYGDNSGCASFDNFTTDLTGNFYGMRAVSLDLTNTVKPTMKFDVAYAQRDASGSDRLGIWYSFNGSTGWMNLQNYEGSTLATAPDHATQFVPDANEWDSITIDLTQFVGRPLVRLAFENNCRFGNVLYIDNVRFYDEQFVGISKAKDQIAPLAFYPNPISDRRLKIDSRGHELTRVQAFDQLGKSYLLTSNNQQGIYTIPLNDLSAGIYSITVDIKGQLPQTKRIIIL